MPGYIRNTVGIGSASGANTSLNLMVNIKKTESGGGTYPQNQANSGPVGLKRWFETYAVTPSMVKGAYTNVKWSEFKGSAIFGCTISIRNETYERYGRNDNGGIRITPLFGSVDSSGGGSFTVTVFTAKGGSSVASGTGTTAFTIGGTGSAGSPGSFPDSTYYVTVTNVHGSGASPASNSFGFYWKCAYNSKTDGQIRSDPVDPNSFNSSTGGQTIITPPDRTNPGDFSAGMTVLCRSKSFSVIPAASTP